jgi:hypothetical protein
VLGGRDVEREPQQVHRLLRAAGLLCEGGQRPGGILIVLREGNGAVLGVLERRRVLGVALPGILDGLLELRLDGVGLVPERRGLLQKAEKGPERRTGQRTLDGAVGRRHSRGRPSCRILRRGGFVRGGADLPQPRGRRPASSVDLRRGRLSAATNIDKSGGYPIFGDQPNPQILRTRATHQPHSTAGSTSCGPWSGLAGRRCKACGYWSGERACAGVGAGSGAGSGSRSAASRQTCSAYSIMS